MNERMIRYLIHIGDAYANLPIGDNFGLSEQVHVGIPANFMLATYGESKIRGEMFVRRMVTKGLNSFLPRKGAF